MSEARPALDQVNIVVRDMEASSDFYRRLGLRIEGDDGEPWAPHHRSATDPGAIDLDLDSTAFASQWDRGWPAGGAGLVLGFKLAARDDVDRLYQDLTEAGYQGQQEPYDAFGEPATPSSRIPTETPSA